MNDISPVVSAITAVERLDVPIITCDRYQFRLTYCRRWVLVLQGTVNRVQESETSTPSTNWAGLY